MRLLITIVWLAVLLALPSTTFAQGQESLCVVSYDEVTAMETPAAEDVTLDGRLGGPLESFLDLYGEDENISQDGCSSFSSISSQPTADGSAEIVTIIDLWADRDSDIESGTLDKPSDANWSIEEATVIASQLLPSDAVLEDAEETDSENSLVAGTSESLTLVLSDDNYTYHGSDGQPGDIEVLFGLSSDGTVWSIAVQLGGIN